MEYLVVFLVIAVFVAVIFVIARKDAKERDEMVAGLTDEQIAFLQATEPEVVGNLEWIQDAIVAKVKDKGGKVDIRMLWYNKTLQNNEFQTITIADASIKKAEQDQHNLKVGDRVKMYFAPEKTVGSVKIMF